MTSATKNVAIVAADGKRLPTVTSDSHYLAEVDDLRRDLSVHVDRTWAIGERVLKLREWATENYGKPLSFEKLAKDLALPNVKRNYLNRIALTAEYADAELRAAKPDWSWFDWDNYRRAQSRITKAKSPNAKDRSVTREELLKVLTSKDSPKSVRQVSNKVAKLRKKRDRIKLSKETAQRREELGNSINGLLNHCHNKPWEEVIREVPNGLLDGMVCDPPFARIGNYYIGRDSAYESTRCLANECDNADPVSAMQTTLALFDYADKVKPHGFLLLFQEGGLPLDPRILAHATNQGWYAYREIHLIKVDDKEGVESRENRQVCAPTPSMMDEPFAPVDLKLTLFYRVGYMPKRIGTASNQNVFFFRSVSRRAVAEVKSGKKEAGYRHHFECPTDVVEAVMQRLLIDRTRQVVMETNGVIMETHGCTAPACVAALRNGWDFIYCETNARNFERGVQRIDEAAEANGKSLLFPTMKKSLAIQVIDAGAPAKETAKRIPLDVTMFEGNEVEFEVA